LFLELLDVLKAIADSHHVSIANVATKYILDKPCVAGVIVGCRLSISDHRKDNLLSLSLNLSAQDKERIEAVAKKGKMLSGDCGDEYRD